MLKPRKPVPNFEIKLVDDSLWRLYDQTPEIFVMLAFYRGRHCPVCQRYLSDLNRKMAEFEKRGVTVLALSGDTKERALDTQAAWNIPNVPLAYGLPIETAREWGLYISTSRGKTSLGIVEPPMFSEPALFLIKPDMTLYASIVQTMPFARPYFADVLSAIDYIVENNYPARGEA